MNWRSTNREPGARVTAFNRSGTMGQRGGGAVLPAWAKLPYWAFDNIKIPLLVGQEVTIYGDTLINVPIENDLTVNYTCAIGTQSGTKDFIINPIESNIGEYQLTCVFKQSGKTFLTKILTLNIVSELAGGAKKILMIGDSTMVGGISYFASQLNSILNNCELTFLGTKGTTVKHEGVSGFTWSNFVTHASSSFVKGGVLNVPAYFTDNSIDTPDLIFIRLGINDTFPHCAVGNSLTDGEITTILSYAKSLIDAFLAFNSDLKIILGIPTISENTGAGWFANYGTAYDQDLYIMNMHKYWTRLVQEFANGAYNYRVDCGHEALFLDRNDGYPKTAGVHNNGVHPDASGYDQLGNAMSVKFNEKLALPKLTVVWENDYAAMSWIDNTGGIGEYEIYESKNGGGYTLVTTTAAGATSYNNATWMNASMNFRIRIKSGSYYSEYSNVVNMNTPIVIKTDQSTLATVIIDSLVIAAGKTININWGDDTNANYTGSNSNVTKNYASTQNPYYITITGDTDSITAFNVNTQEDFYGDMSKLMIPNGCNPWRTYRTKLGGNISNWQLPSSLPSLQIGDSRYTGDLSNWVIPANTSTLYLSNDEVAYKMTGDLSNWILPATMANIYLYNQDFTKLPRGSFVGIATAIGFNASGNNCNTAEIDDFLLYLNNYFETVTPARNAIFNIGGLGMGIPSATGLAAKAGIEAKFTAAGFTATITVNS